MDRVQAVKDWLRSCSYHQLVQLQELSAYAAIPGIAQWIIEAGWLPFQYDPAFPYPEIVAGANAPLEPEDPHQIDDEPHGWNWDDSSGAWQ